MPRPKKSREQVEAMRDRILRAAHELLTEGGSDALTMRAIAERVGVSHMALYTYFQNRDALVAALRQRQRDRIQARQAERLRRAESGDVRQVMREALAFYAQMARERPRVYQFLWVNPLQAEASFANPQQRLEQNVRHLSRLVQLGIDRGVFAPRDPILAAATALSIVNGPLILYHSGRLIDSTLRERMEAEALEAAMGYLSQA